MGSHGGRRLLCCYTAGVCVLGLEGRARSKLRAANCKAESASKGCLDRPACRDKQDKPRSGCLSQSVEGQVTLSSADLDGTAKQRGRDTQRQAESVKAKPGVQTLIYRSFPWQCRVESLGSTHWPQ